jgi:hypothetical protein
LSQKHLTRALDVDVSVLLARPTRIDTAENDQDQGVLPIRRAITAVRDNGEPGSVDELGKSAGYAWSAYWTNRFDLLGELLPNLLTSARATARETDTPAAFAALSDVYAACASTLVHLGHVDLAYLAMERAIGAAERSDDPLRRAALSGWMSWLLLHQTGTADQAQRLAVDEADRVEPRLGKARPQQISVWGSLLISGAVAAARDDQPAEADDLLNLAEAAATRLHAETSVIRVAYQSPFGLPLVVMQSVDVAVVTDRPGRALEVAKKMPSDGLPLLASKARHLADVAYAQTSLRRDHEATDTLLTIERTAPHWMKYQAYPRTIVRELLERERRSRTPQLRGLARRLGVA